MSLQEGVCVVETSDQEGVWLASIRPHMIAVPADIVATTPVTVVFAAAAGVTVPIEAVSAELVTDRLLLEIVVAVPSDAVSPNPVTVAVAPAMIVTVPRDIVAMLVTAVVLASAIVSSSPMDMVSVSDVTEMDVLPKPHACSPKLPVPHAITFYPPMLSE
jgi:hypothetical protein